MCCGLPFEVLQMIVMRVQQVGRTDARPRGVVDQDGADLDETLVGTTAPAHLVRRPARKINRLILKQVGDTVVLVLDRLYLGLLDQRAGPRTDETSRLSCASLSPTSIAVGARAGV
jgi:hypothetical protein